MFSARTLRCSLINHATKRKKRKRASILGTDDPRLAQLQAIIDELAEEAAGQDTASGPPWPPGSKR